MMKNLFTVLATILICGASLLSSCSKDKETTAVRLSTTVGTPL